MTLGIRPRHLASRAAPWPDFNLDVTVDVVEPVGTEEIVHCRLGNTEVLGVFPVFGGPREDDHAYLGFRLENALIFDGAGDDARRIV